jgi:hypothetical protein
MNQIVHQTVLSHFAFAREAISLNPDPKVTDPALGAGMAGMQVGFVIDLEQAGCKLHETLTQ